MQRAGEANPGMFYNAVIQIRFETKSARINPRILRKILYHIAKHLDSKGDHQI
jgi:hypothetical protein